MNEFIKKLIERFNGMKHDVPMISQNFILRKEAIDIINQLAEEYKPCHKPCTDCEEYDLVRNHCPKFCRVIEETVKEIEEKHNGWIPCSERLPEENQRVIVCNIYGAVFVVDFYNGLFQGIRVHTTDNILAWQPFPAPYQPKGE